MKKKEADKAVVDEHKVDEYNKIIDSIQSSDATESQKLDKMYETWAVRDLKDHKAKADKKIKEAGGHVKTPLDDKKEEELTPEDK